MSSFDSGLELANSFLNFAFSVVAGIIGFILPFLVMAFIGVAIVSIFIMLTADKKGA